MTDSGLRTVDYVGGWSNRVDVAARRALMTGFNQVVAKVNEDNAEQLGTEYFEVSYHRGARPTHQVWQGRVYSKKELETVCGLGTVTGLCGANCYHSYSPFIKGIDTPTYSEEELDRMNEEENTPKEYNGKEYTAYEAQQRQRQLETAMRADRQKIELLTQGGADYDTITGAKVRYFQRQDEYVKFSKAMGLPEQWERVTVNGKNALGSKLPKKAESVNKISGDRKDFAVKPGKNINAKADVKLVTSPEYVDKFSDIGVTKEVQKTIADLSSKIILRRNGTAIEEVYAISRDSGKILSHTKGKANYGLDMSDNFKKVLINAKEGSIIILHNHPLNFTFSLNDVHTMSKYPSIGTMIASTHKGEVHYVTGTIGNYSQIERDYRVAYTKNSTRLMYSEEKSRINALKGSLEKAGVRYDYK